MQNDVDIFGVERSCLNVWIEMCGGGFDDLKAVERWNFDLKFKFFEFDQENHFISHLSYLLAGDIGTISSRCEYVFPNDWYNYGYWSLHRRLRERYFAVDNT